mgnify:CR=1 FL=1
MRDPRATSMSRRSRATLRALRAVAHACMDSYGHPSARVTDLYAWADALGAPREEVKEAYELLRRLGLIDLEGYPCPEIWDLFVYLVDGPEALSREERISARMQLRLVKG